MKKIIMSVFSICATLCCCFALSACIDPNPLNNDEEELNYKEIIMDGEVVGYSVNGIGEVSVTDITIPQKYNGVPVLSIEPGAFMYSSITSITLTYGITAIGYNAFMWCNYLTEITIPDSVTEIGDGAFINCQSVKSVQLPSKIDNICKYAFMGCKSLETINVPVNVSKINDYAFSGCYALRTVYYKGTAEEFDNIIIGYHNDGLGFATLNFS